MSSRKPSTAQKPPAPAPSLKQRAARSKAGVRRVAKTETTTVVDWNKPPLGFMASPAIEPFGFANIEEGLRIELERLHRIALAEFMRRTKHLREHMSVDEVRVHEDEICRKLFLLPLALAISEQKIGLFERNLSREAFDYAQGLDLSPIRTEDLTRLYDVFARTAEALDEAADSDRLLIQTPRGHRQTPGGRVLDAEHNRIACLRDACADELGGRKPTTEVERDDALAVRVRNEMRCEGKIRSRALLAEIAEAWGG